VTRRESDIEERPEPSLVFTRRAHAGSPVEIVIVEKGKTRIWPIPSRQLPELLSNLAGYVATEMAKR
jgi:hypothetical protein